MSAIYAIGPSIFEFKELGNASNVVTITETNEEEDTVLTTEVQTLQIKTDQALGPVHQTLSGIDATINLTVFLDLETLAKLCPEWEKGATGFALGNIGAAAKKFELTIKPKGETEAASFLVFPSVTVTSSANIAFKKDGIANVPLVITASSDETTASSKTFGKIFTTGDYTKTLA